MAEQNAPSGYKVTSEQKAGEQAGLDLRPSGTKATRIRKEVRTGFIALGTIIILAIVAGVLSRGRKTETKPGEVETGKVVQSAGSVGSKGVDELQHAAQQQQTQNRQRQLDAANGGIPTAPDSLTYPNPNLPAGDPARDLNLPPTRYRAAGGAGGTGSANTGQNGPRQLTPAEEREAAERSEELAARKSPLGKGSGGIGSALSGASRGGSQPLNALDMLSRSLGVRDAALAAGGGAGAGGAGGSGTSSAGTGDDQNMQGDKASFLANSRKPEDSQTAGVSRVRSLTHYEIQAGWDIPATLEQAIDSDLPGEVRGIVRENVYDTTSGRFLLIPQGSRVIGSYNSRVAYGQNGIQVVWSRLIYPDGSSIELGGLNGQDVRGLSGFRDKVDNHYARLLGFALLTSAFAAGVELASNQNQNSNNIYGTITPSQAVSQAVSQQVGQLGTEITRRNLNIQPTVKIGIGYRFTIRVRKDLIFDQPYREQAPLYAR